MLRRLGDRGEGSLPFVGVILLVATVIAGLLVAAAPERYRTGAMSAVCRVLGQDDCEEGDAPPDDDTPPDAGASPGGDETPSGDETPPGEEEPTGEPSPTDTEYENASDAADQAAEDADALEAEWDAFDLLEEIGKLGLDWLAGDIIACVEKPNFSDCLWALASIVPIGKLGRLLKSIPKVIKLIDRYRDLKRRLENARDARRRADDRLDAAEEACERARERMPNSFAAGTLVLLGDGSRVPIEDVGVGDWIWAADPETGRHGPRRVTDRITGTGRKDLVDLTVDLDGQLGGPVGRITATDGHRFWIHGARDWIDAGRLAPGDTFTTAGGAQALVVAKRRYTRTAKVHNLTVDDLHTYFVGAGTGNVLVHNCGDLAADESPTLGHTINDHINVSDDDLLAKAGTAQGGKAGRWKNQPTAQAAIDELLAKPEVQRRIQNWLRKAGQGGPTELTLNGTHGSGPLGDVADAATEDIGPSSNRFRVVLKKAKGHPQGWVVYTSFPL